MFKPYHFVQCRDCNEYLPLGPANDAPLEVTQELVALFYAETPGASSLIPLSDPEFSDGLAGKDPAADARIFVWESGALAAELVKIGGQR
jgi:hypothetical protein